MSKKQEKMAKRVIETFEKNIIYIGAFLEEGSKNDLEKWWVNETGKELLSKTYMHHMTLHFRPKPAEAQVYPIGAEILLKVVGYAEDEKGQAILVETPVDSQNQHPHITVSTNGSTPPYYSNELLKDGITRVSGGGPVLRAKVGYWDGKGAQYE